MIILQPSQPSSRRPGTVVPPSPLSLSISLFPPSLSSSPPKRALLHLQVPPMRGAAAVFRVGWVK